MPSLRASPSAHGGPEPPSAPDLSAEDRRVLAYASAIGHEFDFPLLAAALETNDEKLAEHLEDLTHRGILREREGGNRFAFVHEDLRGQLYQSLTASRLRVLHRRIAEAMERLYPDPPEEVVPELGRHYFLGRVPEKSYQFNRAAALLALQADSPEAALHHLERAKLDLAQLPDRPGEESAEVDLFLGGLYQAVGEDSQAERCFVDGLARAGPSHPRLRGQLLLGHAEVLQERGQGPQGEATIREAFELLDRGSDLAGMARVHRWKARSAEERGELRDALEETLAAEEIVRRANDPRLQGELDVDVGALFGRLGPETQGEMIPWFERGIARLASVGDFAGVARGYALLGDLLTDSRPAEALDYLVRAREYFERTRDQRGMAQVLARAVPLRVATGNLELAEREYQQGTRLLQRSEDPRAECLLKMAEGALAEARRHPDSAERAYQEAIALADEARGRPEEADAHVALARLLARRGAWSESQRELDAARRLSGPGLRPGGVGRLDQLAAEVASGLKAG